MGAFGRFLKRLAENVAALMLAALFATFVVQIVARYVVNASLGWTVEVCVTLWLWLIFFGAAFVLGERDHVRFDLLAEMGGERTRRILALLAAAAIAIGFIVSLPATLDYISFYRIKKSPTLRIRLDWVFGIYGVFAVAIILRYLWRAVALLRGATPDQLDGTVKDALEAAERA